MIDNIIQTPLKNKRLSVVTVADAVGHTRSKYNNICWYWIFE